MDDQDRRENFWMDVYINVLDNLSISGNIFLGREPTWLGPLKLINRRRMKKETQSYLNQLGLNLSPDIILHSGVILHFASMNTSVF